MRTSAGMRSQLYAALAQAFRKPEEASGADEGGSLIPDLRQAALGLNGEALGPAVEELVDALEVVEGEKEAAIRQLEVEYNRLFVGPGRPEAPPYESFYRNAWGLMVGPSAQEVQRRYTQAGLALVPDRRDLPDHVATELGFMAYLALQEAEAGHGERSTWQERGRSFLRDHLSVWLPLLCGRIKDVARHPFYVALAELTETFVRLDVERSEARHEPLSEGAPGR